ncbi:DUF2326 domain-containing protein [Rhizobium sp. 2YAF20]|uniref:DUF2326 domain-containing protein n=1 Tax=Rhizobium sp. 2YAF20 TaxID=3233027 RepID=UPI003F9A9AC3
MRTFEQVRIFHESIVSNRRHHLGEELDQNKTRLGEIRADITLKGERWEGLLLELQGAGVFSDLASLQTAQSKMEARLFDLERRLNAAIQAENDKTELKSNEAPLLWRLQNDLSERTPPIGAAVLAVNEALKPLYSDRYGALEINAAPAGLQFNVHIEGDKSGGISNMEIDYALLKIATLRLGGPRLFVHDSHLFDGVDARQVATSIELGARLAERLGVQYLVLMNSDEYAKLKFPKDFDVAAAILDVRIDDPDEGGLFGFRFG